MNAENVKRFLLKKRWALLSLAIVTPLGFYSKFYTGPAADWVNDSLGGVLYVIFWSLFFSIILKRSRPWIIAFIVLVATCLLEILQRWHPPFLELFRSTYLGVTLIGNSFAWQDIFHYLIGFTLSGTLLTILDQQIKEFEDPD